MSKGTVSMLQPGFYVGVVRNAQEFRLDESKFTRKSGARPVTSFEELFAMYDNSQPKAKTDHPKDPTPRVQVAGKTTTHSGWVPVSDPEQVKTKALAAPSVWTASGGCDVEAADRMVRDFKQGAAKILKEMAENNAQDDEVLAGIARINQRACGVHCIRVKLLWVSETQMPGGRLSGASRPLWYKEVCLRKFYTSDTPGDDLIRGFAEAIASPELVVNASNHLVVRRRDGMPDGRRGPSFQICRGAWSDKDEGVKVIVDWIVNRLGQTGQT